MLARTMESISKRPILGAIALGAITSCVTLIVALLAIYSLHYLLQSSGGASAAASVFNQPALAVFFDAVIFFPLYETVIGQVIPIEIARRFGSNRWLCIFISAVVFGGGHYLNGGPLHGLVAFSVGILFAALYMLLRRNGPTSSFTGVATAHILHNAILLYVLSPILPSLA